MVALCSEVQHHVPSQEEACKGKSMEGTSSPDVVDGNASPVTDGTRSMSSSSSASPTHKSYLQSPSPPLGAGDEGNGHDKQRGKDSIPIPILSASSISSATPVPDPIQPQAPTAIKCESASNAPMKLDTSSSQTYKPTVNPRAQIAPSGGIRHNLSIAPSDGRSAPISMTNMPSPPLPPMNPILSSKSKSVSDFRSNELKRALKPDLIQFQQKSPKLSGVSESKMSRTYSFSVNDGRKGNKGLDQCQSSALSSNTLHDRRQKRLERNRESARLSRRRRKQYLEVLEERVTYLSEEMDKGRRHHVLNAVQTYKALRKELLQKVLSANSGYNMDEGTAITYDRYAHILRTSLSRTSDELSLSTTFGREYLKSLVLPCTSKFVLWLTLQNDSYFRGGRAASERLSAARIGERMLSCANDKVPPANGMWPLFCNEVGLSYDQEERVRSLQRTILSTNESWLSRHVGSSSEHVLHTSHDAILGANAAVNHRDSVVCDILTPEQKVKFLAWLSSKKRETISNLTAGIASKMKIKTDPMKIDQSTKGKHDAASLYVVNHKLATLVSQFPTSAPTVSSPLTLKKLSRRPSFESLAATNNDDEKSSTGSMKRCSSEIICDDMDKDSKGNAMKKSTSGHSLTSTGQPTTTPEAAQRSASHVVVAALGHVRSIIPPPLSQQRNQREMSTVAPVTSSSQQLPVQQVFTTTTQQHQHSNAPMVQRVYYTPTEQPVVPMTTVSYSNHNQNDVPTLSTYSHPGSQDQSCANYVPTNVAGQDTSTTSLFHQTFQNLRVNSASAPLHTLDSGSMNHTMPSTTVSQTNTTAQASFVATPIPSSVQSAMNPPTTSSNYIGLIDNNEEPQVQLNMSTEDCSLYNVPSKVADDSLLALTEEDWAIGEGFDMELS